MCMYVYICGHLCVHMYVHSCIYACICVHKCICIVHPRLSVYFLITIECILCDMVNIFLAYIVTLYE